MDVIALYPNLRIERCAEEVAREDIDIRDISRLTISPLISPRESDNDDPSNSISGATSGLPPIVPSNGPLTPNMVYTIPPPPSHVFYSRDVIERAQQLQLHPAQEHMRYGIAQSLTKDVKKNSSKSVFSKLKKLGSKKR